MREPAVAPAADQPTVTVVGQGITSAVPDTAVLRLGVETRGATPGKALAACSRALEEVVAAVRQAGSSRLGWSPASSASIPTGKWRKASSAGGGYRAEAAGGPAVEVGEAEVPAMVAVTSALLDTPPPDAAERS